MLIMTIERSISKTGPPLAKKATAPDRAASAGTTVVHAKPHLDPSSYFVSAPKCDQLTKQLAYIATVLIA